MSPIFSTFSLGAKALGIAELSFSFVTSTTTTTHQFTVPASSQAGDLVIYAHTGGANGGSVSLADSYKPAAWTRIYRDAFDGNVNEDSVFDCCYKKIESGDVSSTISVANSAFTTDLGVMLVFRPTKTFTVAIEDTNHQVGDVNPSAQTIDGTAVATLPHLLMSTHFQYGDPVTGRSWTGGTNSEITNTNEYYLRYKMFNIGDTKENVTVNHGDGGGEHNRLFSMIISFT